MSLSRVGLVLLIMRMCEPGGVSVPAPPNRDDIDLAIDRDPWGRPHLPGTSLAGGLRELVHGYADEDTAGRLFGRLLPKDVGRGTVDAVASPIWVLGSRVLDDPATTVRTVTAIDRERGAARLNTLRREEVLPAGTRFEVFLRWDDPDDAELATFLGHLRHWRPLVGHGVTRGRGQAAIDTVAYRVLNLHDPADLAVWLRQDGPDLLRAVTVGFDGTGGAAPALPGPEPTRLEVTLHIKGPFWIGSGEATADADGKPKIARMFREDGRFVVPGSALKGILRSRCEYILRSVSADGRVKENPEPCLDQRCGRCWPCDVFGHGGGQDQAAGSVGGRGRVRVLDTTIHEPGRVERTHVAVDRFTGGARDEQLFTVEALETGHFALTVELLKSDGLDERVWALLRLVLADLDDGLVGVGAGTARGYGTVTVDLAAAEAAGTLPTLPAARAILAAMLTTGVSG